MRRLPDGHAHLTAAPGGEKTKDTAAPTPEHQNDVFQPSALPDEDTDYLGDTNVSNHRDHQKEALVPLKQEESQHSRSLSAPGQTNQFLPPAHSATHPEDTPTQRSTQNTDMLTEPHTTPCVYDTREDPSPLPDTRDTSKVPKTATELDLAHGALLIDPKKIDNFRRFRILFVGILIFISSSTQGVHSLFGTLHLQLNYRFDARKMAIVYLCGQAFGMFVFPFGMLYDWFGPRVVVAVGSIISALGHLLFALAFAGHIDVSVTNCSIFYGLMCWGCYALDVAVLPAVLGHMPRDRGQPTGVLETFSGLGTSFFACLFRGFFNNNFENLMWFMFAVTVVVGVVGTWYMEDAPYMVNRWQQRTITPREQLRKYLIRNRYMSQLVPQRRYSFMTVILVLLNFYLTIQAVVVAYLPEKMTPGKLRGIAIGSIIIVVLILILMVPLHIIDGPTEQDKQVIEAAREKEKEIMKMNAQDKARARRRSSQGRGSKSTPRGSENLNTAQNPLVAGNMDTAAELGAADIDGEAHPTEQRVGSSASTSDGSNSDASVSHDAFLPGTSGNFLPMPQISRGSRLLPAAGRPRRASNGGVLTQHLGLPLYQPAGPDRSLIPVDVNDVEEEELQEHADALQAEHRNQPHRSNHRDSQAARRFSLSFSHSKQRQPAVAASAPATPRRSGRTERKPSGETSYVLRVGNHGDLSLETTNIMDHAQPTGAAAEFGEEHRNSHFLYDHPRVEAITLCGEVFVTPVHKVDFWESLTCIDIWLIFYVTMCTWGVGLTMVGNWNIYIMLSARYAAMEQKHYILFAAMSGVCTAGGRVFLGVYEKFLRVIRERTGVVIVPTLLYPITSVGLLIGLIFWIALPGDKVLILAYIIGPSFYGVSSSITPYILCTIFDRDLGMHYGFCFFAGAIGFVLCYWCSWYLTYKEESSLTLLGERCIGQRRCMNRAVGIYVALVFSSIIPAYLLHRRYSKLVRGELSQRRVIVQHLMRIFRCWGLCGGDEVKSSGSSDENPAVSADGEAAKSVPDAAGLLSTV